jgi:hypothetical protein
VDRCQQQPVVFRNGIVIVNAIVVAIAIVIVNAIGIAAYWAARVCDYALFLNNRTSSAAHNTSV